MVLILPHITFSSNQKSNSETMGNQLFFCLMDKWIKLLSFFISMKKIGEQSFFVIFHFQLENRQKIKSRMRIMRKVKKTIRKNKKNSFSVVLGAKVCQIFDCENKLIVCLCRPGLWSSLNIAPTKSQIQVILGVIFDFHLTSQHLLHISQIYENSSTIVHEISSHHITTPKQGLINVIEDKFKISCLIDDRICFLFLEVARNPTHGLMSFYKSMKNRPHHLNLEGIFLCSVAISSFQLLCLFLILLEDPCFFCAHWLCYTPFRFISQLMQPTWSSVCGRNLSTPFDISLLLLQICIFHHLLFFLYLMFLSSSLIMNYPSKFNFSCFSIFISSIAPAVGMLQMWQFPGQS
ncbi:hypothetical protein VP01_1012g1 [Puccinia sorghi]|uniref:Uncharacterized protein n=1 Tax=Puccinia sorghi TaxID=27349 RepID=A0A0L6VUZ7_9BASI|nr:hypothetical protein VP01_1012g1 [Puccinia sorghi]